MLVMHPFNLCMSGLYLYKVIAAAKCHRCVVRRSPSHGSDWENCDSTLFAGICSLLGMRCLSAFV